MPISETSEQNSNGYCNADIVFTLDPTNASFIYGIKGEERGAYWVLVRKPEGKRPLGRPRRRWVDNIRMDLQEVGCRYVDWIGLAQDRDGWRKLVNAVMNLRVP